MWAFFALLRLGSLLEKEDVMTDVLPRIRRPKYGWVGLLVLLSMPSVLFAAQLVGGITPKLSGQALINELKKGGYIIYFRHGQTSNIGEKDVEDKELNDCAIQRNLSAEGQDQTKEIGAAFRSLQIPIGEVYSSPYCRCLDTARNIFGKVTQTPALHFAIQLDNMKRINVTVQLLALLGTVPSPGTNVALVSHTANLQEAVGIWPKPEGVAHIFRPEGKGQFSYVGMVLPEAWAQEASLAGVGTSASGERGWFKRIRRVFGNLF
jgi:phosphohistidine phosphatase SixA